MRADTLRHLYAFRCVAIAGSVRSAGELMACAPSTVTRAIASLEQRLKATLFDRSAQGMALSQAGRVALAAVERIAGLLASVHAQASRARARSGPVAGIEALYNEQRLGMAVQLARTGRMAPVARAGAVSQPAVSQAIARLEQDLGQPLFVRGADRMRVVGNIGDNVGAWLRSFERVLAELCGLRESLAALHAPGMRPG
jgi:LysR family transcriptional regulator of gallate degradation